MNFYTQSTTPAKPEEASTVLLQQMWHLLVCPHSVTILLLDIVGSRGASSS